MSDSPSPIDLAERARRAPLFSSKGRCAFVGDVTRCELPQGHAPARHKVTIVDDFNRVTLAWMWHKALRRYEWVQVS